MEGFEERSIMVIVLRGPGNSLLLKAEVVTYVMVVEATWKCLLSLLSLLL